MGAVSRMAWPGRLARGDFGQATALGGFFGSRPRREEGLGTELKLSCEPVAATLPFPRLPQDGNAAKDSAERPDSGPDSQLRQ